MTLCGNLKLQELLLPYLEGELSSLEAEEVAKHIQTCKTCEQEVKALEESLRLVLLPLCPSPDTMALYLEEKLDIENAEKLRSHIKKCSSCREFAGAFQELETVRPEKRVEEIPSWFASKLKQTFSKRTLLDYLFSFFFLQRPSLALIAHAALGMLLLFGGLFYNENLAVMPSSDHFFAESKAPLAPDSSLAHPRHDFRSLRSKPKMSINKAEKKSLRKAIKPMEMEGAPTQSTAPAPALTLKSQPTASFIGFYLIFGSLFFWTLAGISAYRLWISRKSCS